MPIINVDFKSLEVVVAAELSKDEVLCKELINKDDIHEINRAAFSLGGEAYREGESNEAAVTRKKGRLVAKILKFRILYGGGAYSFAHDPDFMGVSTSEDYWQEVIDKYYSKYHGVAQWHKRLLTTAQETGKLELPNGRYFPIVPDYQKREPWPLTIIKNYPVQGLGSDLVMLARLRAKQLLKESGLEALLNCTIHDSIVVDAPSKNVVPVAHILQQSVEDVPRLCKQVWNYDFSLPLTCELSSGPNKRDLKELKL